MSQWGGWRGARSHRALQTISTLEDFIPRAMRSQLKSSHEGVKQLDLHFKNANGLRVVNRQKRVKRAYVSEASWKSLIIIVQVNNGDILDEGGGSDDEEK